MSSSLLASEKNQDVEVRHSMDISVKGKWSTVPALRVGDDNLIVQGRWLRVAVVADEDWLENEIINPDQCARALTRNDSSGLHADIFTFTQKPPMTSPRYQYPMERESVAVVATSSFEEWWKKLPQATRKNVRRAEKRGVTVKACRLDDQLVKGLVELNNDSPLRQRKAYVHYGKTFEQVKRDQSTFLDRSEFIAAYFGNELIGFLKLVYRGAIASILQFLPKNSQSDKRPANALLAKAVELCEAKGISHLTYGLFNYGHKRDCPLREFKVRNGFYEMLIPRFYVPLTAWGRFCMKLNLHHGLLGILPESWIVLGVGVRDDWNSFMQSMSRHSSMAERPGL